MCIRDRIIYLGGTTHPTGRDRAAGYVRAMQESGLAPRIFNVHYIQDRVPSVSYTHLRAHETVLDLVCRLLLEKKKKPLTHAMI